MTFKLEDTAERAAKRKSDHIRICTDENIESKGQPFSSYSFIPEALPEFNYDDVDISQDFLGESFSMPYLITGMTGGVEQGQFINETLAKVAQEFNIPMGLGSLKLMLQDPSYRHLFDVRKVAPKAFLLGNIGAVSFNYGFTVDQVLGLVEDLGLNAFAIHLNALQECVQPEGETLFANLLPKIEETVKRLPVPVLVKEVGSGMSAHTFKMLKEVGVKAIDLGGNGGTSWSAIEGLRAQSTGRRLGELFRNWGFSTEESLLACSKENTTGDVEVVATGGMRNGLQAAKALALGANMVGVGLPFFKAVVSPHSDLTAQECLVEEMTFFKESLKMVLFCSGCRNLEELRLKDVLFQRVSGTNEH